MRVKQSGSILLPTIIISVMLLALAMALTKIVSDELQFSSDLLLGERAYFAGESGVEAALLHLKNEPINLIEEKVDLGNSTSTAITTFNAVDGFDFVLNGSESLRWRLEVDRDEKILVVDSEIVDDFEISGQGLKDDVQWKIQCAGVNGTLLLQERAASDKIGISDEGVLDDGNSVGDNSIDNFLSGIADGTKCFISLSNFGNNVVEGRVEAVGKLSPAQTKVRARGSAGGREKIIEFEYRQKNLSPFFDFGLLQSE